VKLGLDEVAVEQEASSADSADENVVRKQLTPLGEARAVAEMLTEGDTLDGAAEVQGWTRQLVGAREDPRPARVRGATPGQRRAARQRRRGAATPLARTVEEPRAQGGARDRAGPRSARPAAGMSGRPCGSSRPSIVPRCASSPPARITPT